MTAVRAVVFDVGNVLYHWDRRNLFKKLIENQAELDRFLDCVVPLDWHNQHDAGRPINIMIEERVLAFPQHETLIRAYSTRWLETIPGPINGMIAIVDALARRGTKLFAITNFGEDFWNMFRPTAPVFDHFEDIIVSGIEKQMKPDPAIFNLALGRFGLTEGEGLFIDDVLHNVDAARDAGFVGHHFTNAKTLRAALVALELLPGQTDDMEDVG